ncbi:hypothetical protein LCL89_02865 [Halobacillus yeomjeoni]|uniref:hypothetical protein n=1 Tax=Halobacillus yeomjeoni TaxID=311194 RepID=UPI001CD48216|nr:hypothetical protein [Halobacillus yeomjeoni]MCA0982984.1 hypothetical protein [Halobacillus yeomjeoni]
MKRKSYSDEELKNILKDMPKVEDRQSKHDLYRSIQPEVNKSKRKFAPWIMPGVATAAVLAVLVIVVPMVFNSANQPQFESADRLTGESSNQPEVTEEDPPLPKFEEESGAGEEGASTKSNSPNEFSTAESDSSLQFEQMVMHKPIEDVSFQAYTGMNAEVVIPLTLGPGLEASDISLEEAGLSNIDLSELTFEVDSESETATVIFPENFTVSGSTAATMLVETIRWKLQPENLTQISIRTKNGSKVDLGNYGMLDQLKPIDNKKYAYVIYQFSQDKRRFLAPVELKIGSIEQALNEMKVDRSEKYLSSSVPAHVTFTQITSDGDTLVLDFEHEQWKNDQQLLTMVEAILMTAKIHGYSQVSFEPLENRIGFYDLSGLVEVPNAANPIMNENSP